MQKKGYLKTGHSVIGMTLPLAFGDGATAGVN
jgi:hypothetical protein